MKKTNQPKVTVLMTAYNAELFVGKAIKSILDQTYKNFEFIIVDDASADSTAKIIKSFARRDKRIIFIPLDQNVGPSMASNIGIQKATGEFLARMDADDIAYPDRIYKQVSYLVAHPQTVIVGGQCDLIDSEGNYIADKIYPTGNKSIYHSLFKLNPIQHPACMINLRKVDRSEVIGDNFGLLAHDLDLVFRLSQKGKLANLPDKVLYYRQHADSLSLKHPKKTFFDTVRIRHKAVLYYGYKPTLKGIAYHIAQIILVGILPESAIYPVFKFLRGIKSARKTLQITSKLQRYTVFARA